MKTSQLEWNGDSWSSSSELSANVVFVFATRETLESDWAKASAKLKETFPDARFIGCSTAGQIAGTLVSDENIVATAVEFEKSEVKIATVSIDSADGSFGAGKDLADKLSGDQFRHLFILSDGLNVNGTDLTEGVRSRLGDKVVATGGLAGDSANFEKTLLVLDDTLESNQIIGLGLYGDSIRTSSGQAGGWQSFGPERLVTKSEGSTLYELDNQSALELYKKYLGDHAEKLPASALLFPLNVKASGSEQETVRTILSVDEKAGSMTFAGDIPKGAGVTFMRAKNDGLIDGAREAAEMSAPQGDSDKLAILISCVGRKLVLKQEVEGELEAVSEVLGGMSTITGFYSYGELAPTKPGESSALHNQTMTVTLLSEA